MWLKGEGLFSHNKMIRILQNGSDSLACFQAVQKPPDARHAKS
jgi:hypothetical protein